MIQPRVELYIESIILPVLPGLVGIYLVYIANKKGMMLIIKTPDSVKKLRLGGLAKQGNEQNTVVYLGEKLTGRLVVVDHDFER